MMELVDEELKEGQKFAESYTSLARRHNSLITATLNLEAENKKLIAELKLM